MFVSYFLSLAGSYPGVAVPELRTALSVARTASHVVQVIRSEGEGWAAAMAVAGSQQASLDTERGEEEGEEERSKQHLEQGQSVCQSVSSRTTYLQQGHSLSPATHCLLTATVVQLLVTSLLSSTLDLSK